ncbi:ABC transporter permease [Xylanivirga thermophila]|uniref:ABC transporter permease n=1 Tax=Xylanivirga thermophila TaxID=2496273 RepID=UPI001A924015|nr:ABC transporter permease subunit [Xylanivirga thermophila]
MRANSNQGSAIKHLKRDWQLLLILLPGMLFYIIFRYGPMYGIVIAFKDYNIFEGVSKSPWVGFKYFDMFFKDPNFYKLFRNTFLIGIYSLFFTFPFPVLFAILLNEVKNVHFKKTVQTASYLPSFLSVVVICSMAIDFLSPNNGMINNIRAALGLEKIYYMTKPEWFRTVYIMTEIWQGTGFNAIIYIAAITAIDPSLYEAAEIDGCSRVKKMWYITLPAIMPTIVTLFIIKSGQVFKVGYEKILLLYNPATYEVADVFSTFVYRKGLVDLDYSYATAVGLFESVVALALLLITNTISKKVNEQSLW